MDGLSNLDCRKKLLRSTRDRRWRINHNGSEKVGDCSMRDVHPFDCTLRISGRAEGSMIAPNLGLIQATPSCPILE